MDYWEWWRTPDKNNHIDADGSGPISQRFALDIFTRHVKNEGKHLEDYESFGAEVIAPADGVICQVVDGSIDVEIGESDNFVFPGNMIIIDHENGEWSELAHLKYKSIRVKVGDRVNQGDILGLCGNSGNTSEPHIHYQLQDNALMHRATGLPIKFSKIKVDGEVKKNYEPERNERVENL